MSLHYFQEIERLDNQLVKLSDVVEQQVKRSIHALSDYDTSVAQNVIKDELKIDSSEIKVEEDCLKLLVLHQPVANDLRMIISVMKININLERIGDHAVMIAEKVVYLADMPKVDVSDELFDLSEKARMMLKKSMLAFVETDMVVAQNVLELGQKIKELAEKIESGQVESIKASPKETEQHLSILKVCRHLQRIADHATNIAEDIIFLMSGDIIRHTGIPA